MRHSPADGGRRAPVARLACQSQLPVEVGGLGGCQALYISTEGRFPMRRFQQMGAAVAADARYKAAFPSSLLRSVCIEECATMDGLVAILVSATTMIPLLVSLQCHRCSAHTAHVVVSTCVVPHATRRCPRLHTLDVAGPPRASLMAQERIPRVCRAGSPIGLVVVDSIAALFRGEFSSSRRDLMDRSKLMFRMSALMKRVNADHGVAFLVVNQATDVVVDEPKAGADGGSGASLLLSSRHVIAPALGVAWSNCVSTR